MHLDLEPTDETPSPPRGRNRLSAALFAAAGALAAPAAASPGAMALSDPMVGGAAMSPRADIVANASKSADHTTLVAAVKAAGLVETLQSPGPFTVFAPTDEAFGMLPAGTVESLVQPAQKATLTEDSHLSRGAGRLLAADIVAMARAGGGVATLTTVQGSKLTLRAAGGGRWEITDGNGGKALITIADVVQSNGVVHVIDGVLIPG